MHLYDRISASSEDIRKYDYSHNDGGAYNQRRPGTLEVHILANRQFARLRQRRCHRNDYRYYDKRYERQQHLDEEVQAVPRGCRLKRPVDNRAAYQCYYTRRGRRLWQHKCYYERRHHARPDVSLVLLDVLEHAAEHCTGFRMSKPQSMNDSIRGSTAPHECLNSFQVMF